MTNRDEKVVIQIPAQERVHEIKQYVTEYDISLCRMDDNAIRHLHQDLTQNTFIQSFQSIKDMGGGFLNLII